MPRGKWDREQTAREDKQQVRLNPQSPTFLKVPHQTQVDMTITYTDYYLCPFCLHRGKINEFLISTKKGYHRGLGHCPECNNNMQLKTLTQDMTPEQFAEFVCTYVPMGFWHKVPFDKFNSRLKQIGWSYLFWARYKQLRGENIVEHYSDY